jgi:DNA-binding MarR family transcriptional regulator
MVALTRNFSLKHYQVEDSVGFLLGRARAKLAKSLDAALVNHDITHAQGGIVLMLATGKFSTAAELARELYIDSASMTRMIDRLEKRKLIVRSPRDDDRRVINLLLTLDGQELAKQLPAIYAAVLNHNFAGFSAEEIGALRNLLRKFLANEVTVADTETINKPN